MQRRAWLAATGTAIIGATGTALAFATGRRPPDLPEDICHSRRPLVHPVAYSPLPSDLSFAGTRLFKEGFLDDLARAYHRTSGRTLQVVGGGCDDGIAAVRNRRSHIGGLCCPVRGSQAHGLEHIQVGWDVKALLAHPDLPIKRLRLPELREIVAGRIRNWSSLRGPDLPVTLVLHDHCPDYAEPARAQLLGAGASWSPHALMAKTDQKHLETMMRFENSLGINSWILAEPLVAAGRLKVLAVDGVLPTAAGIDRRYPLLGPMNMIFQQWVPELMQPFFGFLFGEAGQRIVARRIVPASAREAGWARLARG